MTFAHAWVLGLTHFDGVTGVGVIVEADPPVAIFRGPWHQQIAVVHADEVVLLFVCLATTQRGAGLE